MELLKQFAGEKEDSCVREINFTSGTSTIVPLYSIT